MRVLMPAMFSLPREEQPFSGQPLSEEPECPDEMSDMSAWEPPVSRKERRKAERANKKAAMRRKRARR